jgi:tetratricopeptide (TPR) repeat protein
MQQKNKYGRRDTTALFRVAAAFIVAGLALCSAVSIATADDRAICGSMPPKSATIAACSRIIDTPRTSTHDHAMALALRAGAYSRDQNVPAALSDYSAAIGLNPEFQFAYKGRGILFFNTGDVAHAIADLDVAVRLDPRDAKALYVRGAAKRKNGDEAGGSADIAAAQALDPDIANKP